MKWVKGLILLIVTFFLINYRRMSSKLDKNDKIIADLKGQVSEEKWKNELSKEVIQEKTFVSTNPISPSKRMHEYGWSKPKGKDE